MKGKNVIKWIVIVLVVIIGILIVSNPHKIASIFDTSKEKEKTKEVKAENIKSSVDAFGILSWEADIINETDNKKENVLISVACYDESRIEIGSASSKIKYIEPGETLHAKLSGTCKYDPKANCEYSIKYNWLEDVLD